MAKKIIIQKAGKPMQYGFVLLLVVLLSICAALAVRQAHLSSSKVTDQYKRYRVVQ